METVYVNSNDPNFFEEYNVEVRQDQEEWIDKLRELREQILSGNGERLPNKWTVGSGLALRPPSVFPFALP